MKSFPNIIYQIIYQFFNVLRGHLYYISVLVRDFIFLSPTPTPFAYCCGRNTQKMLWFWHSWVNWEKEPIATACQEHIIPFPLTPFLNHFKAVYRHYRQEERRRKPKNNRWHKEKVTIPSDLEHSSPRLKVLTSFEWQKDIPWGVSLKWLSKLNSSWIDTAFSQCLSCIYHHFLSYYSTSSHPYNSWLDSIIAT